MKKKTFALLLAAALLCGCQQTQTVKELPKDTPYNRFVMETENGYYTNYGTGMFLRFYERNTENQIFLCAKPECLHNGSETCVATYKNLEKINTVLYDGALYILTLEKGETVSLSLYKAALDGTSITKVSDVFTAGNPSGEENVEFTGDNFIIHKGYAYIPYNITVGSKTFGFAGGGLVKINISDGSVKQLYTGEDYFSAYPHYLQGNGDHIWFIMRSYNYNQNGDDGIYICNIKTDEMTNLLPGNNTDVVVSDTRLYKGSTGENFKEDRELAIYYRDKEKLLHDPDPYDGFTLFLGGFKDHIDTIIAYKDMVIVAYEGKILIYNESGEKLGEIVYCEDTENIVHSGTYMDGVAVYDGMYSGGFAVSDDKIYISDSYFLARRPSEPYNDRYDTVVYSCPIESIISGTGEWKFEYGTINEYYIRNGIER